MRKPQVRLLLVDTRKWLGKKVRRSPGSNSDNVGGDGSATARLFPPGGL